MADYNTIHDESYKTLENLHLLFRKNWIKDGYESRDEQREFGLRGLDMLETYYSDPKDNGKKNLIIEQMVYKDMGEFILCGKLDKVYVRDDDKVEILDYKSGNSINPIDSLQLYIYLILAEEKLGYYPDAVSYYYLAENKKIIKKIDEQTIDEAVNYILHICTSICKHTEYRLTPTPYCATSCQYNNLCMSSDYHNLIGASVVEKLNDDSRYNTMF